MKSTLLTTLRDKHSTIEEFREASDKMGEILAHTVMTGFEKEVVDIETPMGPTKGHRFNREVLLVPILRTGLVLLSPFLKVFPKAKVGMVGVRRNEETATPEYYYHNIPEVSSNAEVIVLDPMLATGGSVSYAVDLLMKQGVKEEQITAVFVISAPEGIEAFTKRFPNIRILIAEEDEKLTPNKFIFPGLGDFGDRYYGTN